MNKYFARIRNIFTHPGTTAGIALATLGLLAAGCSPSAQAAVKPTWISAQISGKTVTVPVSEIQKDTIVHFRLPFPSGGSETFMAYVYNGKTYARADVCPPCRSTSFSLAGSTLVCDTCGTVFDAATGDGKSGACVNFPKADVPFQVENGNLVMNADEMNTAYQNTLAPGRP